MANKYIKHTLPSELSQDEFMFLRQRLREHLVSKVKILYHSFDTIVSKRKNSLGEEQVDPSIHLGTGGVIVALLKYARFLRLEKKDADLLLKTEAKLEKAIEINIELADFVRSKKQYGERYASYMMSESVGISTMVCLHMLHMGHKFEVDLKALSLIIKNKIVNALPRCNNEQEL
jgi:hypothetical protein